MTRENPTPKNVPRVVANGQIAGTESGGDMLQKVVLLIVSLRDRRRVAEACIEKLGVSPSEVHVVISDAYERIRQAAKWSTEEALGEALVRVDDIYQRALQIQDTKTALAAQKEKAKLMGLYALARRRTGTSPVPEVGAPR